MAYVVEKTKEENYEFSISPRLSMNLKCAIDNVKFRRFRAGQIKGNLQVANQIASTDSIQLTLASGKANVRSVVNAQQPDKIKVDCNGYFHQLAVDSIFYMFENFNQDFILDKHIRGLVTAQVQSFMTFDRGLNMDVPSLVADVKTNVTNGGLINFEPMQKLSKFIKRYELANMQFSEMENNIHIENKTVYIPEMEIRSNVSNLSIEGTHTFDQVMNYKLKIPMYNFMGKRAREVANENSSNLFLKITGTSDNYIIEYDKEAVREKITEDWQQEKQEFKELLKGKKTEETKTHPSQKQAEEEEEYFDFDE